MVRKLGALQGNLEFLQMEYPLLVGIHTETGRKPTALGESDVGWYPACQKKTHKGHWASRRVQRIALGEVVDQALPLQKVDVARAKDDFLALKWLDFNH